MIARRFRWTQLFQSTIQSCWCLQHCVFLCAILGVLLLSVRAQGQEPLKIITTTFPDATVGGVYGQVIQASGGVPPYSWSVSVGSLPSGLSLDGTTGQISGSAAFPGKSRFTAQVQDSTGSADSKSLQILVL